MRSNQDKFVKLLQGHAEGKKHSEDRGARGKILNKNDRLMDAEWINLVSGTEQWWSLATQYRNLVLFYFFNF